MRSYQCLCSNRLFFHNCFCIECGRDSGLCPNCRKIVALSVDDQGTTRCGNGECGIAVAKCQNYSNGHVCNCLVSTDVAGSPPSLCRYCQLTIVIPSLKVAGNLDKWRRLEAAKNRVLHTVESVGLPVAIEPGSDDLALSFDFREDGATTVVTSHCDGRVMINIKEADSVTREVARVHLGENQRSLVGHFRHELGHYYWARLVVKNAGLLNRFRRLFGDENKIDYALASKNYYANGPLPNWSQRYISAYAGMHPWEDFAESFGTYLDMVTVVDTAVHFGQVNASTNDFDSVVAAYVKIGVAANEMNRDMGLLDLVPEIFVGPIVDKLKFVHDLCRRA